jgi:transposase
VDEAKNKDNRPKTRAAMHWHRHKNGGAGNQYSSASIIVSTRVGLRRVGGVFRAELDGATFRAWVEQFLAPTLDAGDIVVADNLGSHKVAGVREAIAARGASMMLLPSCSPNPNPIEQLFAKLKSIIRALAPCSREVLFQAIGHALSQVSPVECLNLADKGYRQSA